MNDPIDVKHSRCIAWQNLYSQFVTLEVVDLPNHKRAAVENFYFDYCFIDYQFYNEYDLFSTITK
jgi:hypothetical protein